MNKQILFLFSLIFLDFYCAKAQTQPTAIVGYVKEKSTGNTVEFANVALKKAGDSLIIKGTTTNAEGFFKLDQLTFGTYDLHIYYVGYQRTIIKDIVLNANAPFFKLDKVELSDDSEELSEVVVSATKDVIQQTTEGTVINAAANISQSGGTAQDILKNAPSVNIDASGNVQLRGSNANVLINGRNSGFGGFNRGGGGLDQINADEVESIEIGNIPSARFDADGVGGFINVKLKKDKDMGNHISVNGSVGNRFRFNGGVRLNHRSKNWNFFTSYNGRVDNRWGDGSLTRSNYLTSGTQLINQGQDNKRQNIAHNIRYGVDFYISDKEYFNFEGSIGLRTGSEEERLATVYTDSSYNFLKQDYRISNTPSNNMVQEYVLTYHKEYDQKGKELNITLSTNIGNGTSNNSFNTQAYNVNFVEQGRPVLQNTDNKSYNNLSVFQIDYALPIKKNKGLLEMGYKGIARSLNNDFILSKFDTISNSYLKDVNFSNTFAYNEQVHAAYLSYRGDISDKIKFTAGMRFEKVFISGNSNDNLKFNKDYFNIFPTFRLLYNPNESTQFRLSYSRRINRPGFDDLNPFVNISNALSYRSGNPNLNPELINSFELTASKNWEKFSFSPSVYYRYRDNAIQRLITVDNTTGIALVRPVNTGYATTYGLEAVSTVQIVKNFDMQFTYSLFQNDIYGGTDNLNRSVLSWYAKWITNFVLFKDVKFQISTSYYSPFAVPQGTFKERYSTDIGIQKPILKQKGNISFSVQDMFYSQVWGLSISDVNYAQNNSFRRDTRSFILSFRYKI